MKRRYYLAYGSNLNVRQMQMRCQQAKPVGSVTLEGYELLFRGIHGSAVATVESNPSSTVPCALWLISSRDEAALDIYEGWPRLYRKEMMPVKLGKRRIRVMVYVMNEGHPVGAPSCYYFNTILKGYGDFGLNPATLYMAAKNAIKAAAPYKPLY